MLTLFFGQKYENTCQHRIQEKQQQLEHLQHTERQWQTLVDLFDPHYSPFPKVIARLQNTSPIAFEKNISKIAMLAGITHLTAQLVKDCPSTVLLDVRGTTEEAILKFLRGLEQSCLNVPYIEKVAIYRTLKEGIHMHVRLVRCDCALPMEVDAPYALPTSLESPTFRIFSRPSVPNNRQAIFVEGCMLSSQGAQASISGKWLHVGDRVLQYRIKDIDSHGVYLEDKQQTYYVKIGTSFSCQQASKSR
jgi:hypothetical protein